MKISFAHSDLDKWASFSNDYNPIHFDEEVARTFGYDGVLVHGMLAIMEIMNEIPRLVDVNHEKWFEWKCIIKKPLPINSTFALDVASLNNSDQWNYHLKDIENSGKSLRGTFGFGEKPVPIETDADKKTIADINSNLKEFRLAYPNMNKLWNALNAILFADYLGRNTGHVLEKEIKQWLNNSNGSLYTDNLITMHTNHKIQVSPSLFVRTMQENVTAIEYTMNIQDVIENSDSMYAMLEFTLWVDGSFEMAVDMGLIVMRN